MAPVFGLLRHRERKEVNQGIRRITVVHSRKNSKILDNFAIKFRTKRCKNEEIVRKAKD
jgi:hypothetical protein